MAAHRDVHDVVVVGGGLMGAASAWALTRRGRSVLLVEQFESGHARGSSHGSSRIVRRAYGDALYTRLTGRAFELWRELESSSGRTLLRMLGGVDFGPGRSVDSVAEHLEAAGVLHEVLPAAEAETRWPGMRFAGGVVFHEQAGTLDSRAAVEAFLSCAAGAEVRFSAGVRSIAPSGDGASVQFADGSAVRASCVVVAAGAWVQPLVGGLVALPRLTVEQQQVFHFPRRDASAPPWPSVIHQDVHETYHLAGGRDGGTGDDRKVGEHDSGTPTTANDRPGVVDPRSRVRVVDYVRRWLPGLEPTPRAEATCLYTVTPSQDFILDRVGPIVVCSPCSGHGAKFAPLVGEFVADLVAGSVDVPSRFRLAAHASAATGSAAL